MFTFIWIILVYILSVLFNMLCLSIIFLYRYKKRRKILSHESYIEMRESTAYKNFIFLGLIGTIIGMFKMLWWHLIRYILNFISNGFSTIEYKLYKHDKKIEKQEIINMNCCHEPFKDIKENITASLLDKVLNKIRL